MSTDPELVKERQKGQLVGLVLGGLVAAALVAFVFQNTSDVEVEWLAWEVNAPKWLVLLVGAAGAVVLERLASLVRRRRKRSR